MRAAVEPPLRGGTGFKPVPTVAQPTPAAVEPQPVSAELRTEGTQTTKGVTVKGNVSAREDVFIDGELEGTVRLADAILTVGPNGHVRAEIEAREILVEGRVQGKLHGHDRVRISPSGWVRGDVLTHGIVIEEGAFFLGRVEVLRPEEAQGIRTAGSVVGAAAVQAVSVQAKDQVE